MSAYLFIWRRLTDCMLHFETRVMTILGLQHRLYDPSAYALSGNVPVCSSSDSKKSDTILEQIIGNGFLYAVPTKRRSIERNLTRRWAYEKQLHPKKDLVMCHACGHFHLKETICGNCYNKVREETEAIHAAMASEWKLEPVDKEIVILYDNDDKKANDNEFWQGKRIVEVKRERPMWFHNNLKVKTTVSKSSQEDTRIQTSKTILTQVK